MKNLKELYKGRINDLVKVAESLGGFIYGSPDDKALNDAYARLRISGLSEKDTKELVEEHQDKLIKLYYTYVKNKKTNKTLQSKKSR